MSVLPEITPEQLAELNLVAELARDAANFRSSTMVYLQKGGQVEELHAAIDAGEFDFFDYLEAKHLEENPPQDPETEEPPEE